MNREVRRLKRQLREAKRLLRTATADCSESWQEWIHERDCHGGEDNPEDCKCDGIYIVGLVKKNLRPVASLSTRRSLSRVQTGKRAAARNSRKART